MKGWFRRHERDHRVGQDPSFGTGRATERSFGAWTFRYVGLIEPERCPDGSVKEFLPQDRYAKAVETSLNRYGAGPFCRFKVPGAPHRSGVYVLTSDDNLCYVGIAQDLAQRWGLSGYGSIQPKNCYVGGQSTNCKVNAAVLPEVKAGRRLDLYFLETADDRQAIEKRLIRDLHPLWNVSISS